MGVHNSSYLPIERRVANYWLNMKAFMTLCAFLAGSVSADSQHILNRISFDQLTSMTSPLIPAGPAYNMYPSPINPISYTNVLDYSSPLVYHLIKREAEPDTPYVFKTEVVNPEDGSEYRSEVQVDRNGNGRSYQRVEQKEGMQMNNLMDRLMDQMNPVNNYQLNRDHLRMDQRQMDQMRMNQRQMDQMSRDQMRMAQVNRDQMRMDQRQMDMMRMDQMNRGQMRMDQQRQMDSRVYSMESNRMMDRDMMNCRLCGNMMNMDSQMANQMNMNNHRNNQVMMGAGRRMMKREANISPAFTYTIMTEHPSEMRKAEEQLRSTGRMSYRIPSSMRMMSPYQGMYMMRPAMGQSDVTVYRDGQSYGFRT